MVDTPWLVIQCPNCSMCHGSKKKSERCQHCGSALGENGKVVATATTAQALQIQVALANTPEELRDELRKKLFEKDETAVELDEPSLASLFSACQKIYSVQEFISHEELSRFLELKGSSMLTETFIGHLMSEGLILQRSPTTWQFIE
jgi:hypothetical protein